MRGASALGETLKAHAKEDVRFIVIWLPVLPTDLGPPSEEVRRPLRDPRVTEFWDPDRWASPLMMERAAMLARARGGEPDWGPDAIAWDLIARFPPGVAWEDPFPSPDWWSAPVVESMVELAAQLAAAE